MENMNYDDGKRFISEFIKITKKELMKAYKEMVKQQQLTPYEAIMKIEETYIN